MQKVQTHKIYGLVTGLVMMLMSFGTHVANLSDSTAMQWAGYLPLLIGIIMNAYAFSKANNQFVSFGSVWSSGFKASAIIALVTVAGVVLMLTLFPEIKERALEKAMIEMEEGGNVSEEQIETAMNMTKRFFLAFAIGGTLLSTLFFGAIFSLIGAAVAPKKGEGNPFTPTV